jgi:RND family efflux transporter MFP subunit
MIPRVAVTGLVLFLSCFVATGCAAKPPTTSSDTAVQVPKVTLINPERRTIHRAVEQPGTIEAFEQTPLHAKIAGYVEIVRVDIGDRVDKGQVLAELSVPEMVEELNRKEALLAQAKAEAKQAEAALAAAKANVKTTAALVKEAEAGRDRADALVARWKSEYERLQKVKQTIDQQQLEETRYQLKAAEATRAEVEAKVESAKAARDESTAKRDKAEADVSAANARQGVAEAARDREKALLDYAKVRAPYAGVVTRRNVDTGHFLQPNAANKGEALFMVMRSDKVRIFVDVPETAAPLVGKDTPARIRVQALTGQDFKGTVTRTSWALDPKARTLRAEIDLDNPDGKLRPGMYAYATLTVERDKTMSLPASAVVIQPSGTFCFRVVDGKARRMPIEIGLSGGGWIEVLRKQSKPSKDGEPVWEEFTGKEEIVADATALADGQTVTVTPAKP